MTFVICSSFVDDSGVSQDGLREEQTAVNDAYFQLFHREWGDKIEFH